MAERREDIPATCIPERELGHVSGMVQAAVEKGYAIDHIDADIRAAFWRGYNNGVEGLEEHERQQREGR